MEDKNCSTETGVTEDSQTPSDGQQISNILTIIENLRSSIGLSNPISATNSKATFTKFIKKSDLWIRETTCR